MLDTLFLNATEYRLQVTEPVRPPLYRFAWDDENPDYGYRSRTQQPDWPDSLPNPPAVLRYYPLMREQAGDYRVRLATPYDWKPVFLRWNDNDEQKFNYWTAPGRAQFNNTGWDRFAYVGMSGNFINVLEQIGEWYRFETLKQSDASRAMDMTRESHPQFVHSFHCVGFRNGQTVRIESTGTPRGIVLYPLVTVEGFAYVPVRHVVRVQ